MNVHSVSAELATVARKTRGTVPPKLVGASTTVVGDKMYLFGGRLVVERRMLSDLYVFDLQTFTWARIEHAPNSTVPGPRYFHSADTWNNHLVIFGGMGYKTADQAQESLCVLNDVCFYSLAESRWLPADETPPSPLSPQSLIPRARYAHLSSVSSNMLFIIGGQDLANGWLDDIHVYDLPSRSWVHRSDYPRHCGTYRSVALSSSLCVRSPNAEPSPPPAPRFRSDAAPSVLPVTSPDTFVQLPYSTPPTPNFPSEIFLYSNYNFTDVKRELEVFTPQPPSSFTITDRSTSMTGVALPPGLRFPTGALLGTSLIIAGTYLAHSYQAFSIWSLDLTTMSWSRIEPGTALATGSWCRAVLWRESNKLLVFGNREGNLVEDYNHRLLSWDHVAYIDLEAFAIYQPPSPGLGLGREAQAMGLAALEDGAFTDFEVVCDDGRRIACSRKLLEDRWPWFRNQRRRYVTAASEAVDNAGYSPVPPLPAPAGSVEPILPRPDPRLTPRALHLAEPYPITVAFLQYLYAQALLTPLQHAPAVLSALLLLSSTYELTHLRDLVKHAMHRALSAGGQGVSGVYDVATLCDCQSLRLRAMRMFKNSKRPSGRPRTGRSDHERHGGSGSSHGRGSGHHHHHARPRGLSDANQSQPTSSGSAPADQGQGFGNGQTNGSTSHSLVTEGSSSMDGGAKAPLLLRRPSKKGPSGRSSDLEPVSEIPSFSEDSSSGEVLSSPAESRPDYGLTGILEYPISDDEDDFDPELLGLDTSFISPELGWSSTDFTRASYNARPSGTQFAPNPPDSEDYFFGTEPDHSPLTSSFPPPERTTAFHLPYRASRSASFSDTPSLTDTPSITYASEESHSSQSTSSANSSVPVTPLSPALAEIVDAVAKVAVVMPSPDRRLPRQTSLQSIHEHFSSDDHRQSTESEYDKLQSLSNFPLPPQNALSNQHHHLPRIKTSLSNISEVESTRSQDWLRIDTTITSSRSPGESLSSLELSASPRSLSGKSSFDRLIDRRSSMTPVPQSGGGLARLLNSKRSSSRLEKEFAKARNKADKLEQKLREQGVRDEQRMRDQSDKELSQTHILSGLWSPKSPKSSKPDEKKRKKELDKQKLRGIAEEAKLRAENRGFESSVGKRGEKWAVSGVGGL